MSDTNESNTDPETLWSSDNVQDHSHDSIADSLLSPAPSQAGFNPAPRRLTEAQAEKLRRYLEDQVLEINRNYIQRLNGGGYTDISMLITALNGIVDIIWYSITSTTHYGGLFEFPSLLKIADEFIDELNGYYESGHPPTHPKEILRFLQRLDDIFSTLLEQKGALSQTDKVRIESITERSRVAVVTVFSAIKGYEMDVAKVYEKTLENTT